MLAQGICPLAKIIESASAAEAARLPHLSRFLDKVGVDAAGRYEGWRCPRTRFSGGVVHSGVPTGRGWSLGLRVPASELAGYFHWSIRDPVAARWAWAAGQPRAAVPTLRLGTSAAKAGGF